MSEDAKWTLIGCLLAVLLTFGVVGWKWYSASVQRDVYRRQGVQMTTWEVFLGAKPVERYIKE